MCEVKFGYCDWQDMQKHKHPTLDYPMPAIQMQRGLSPHKCPVCNGAGKVNKSLYDNSQSQTSSCNNDVKCLSCAGTGIVWG